MSDTPEDLKQETDPLTSQTAEPTVEELKQQLAQMQAQLDANITRGKQATVETESGPKTVQQLWNEIEDFREEQRLAQLKSERYWAAQEAKSYTTTLRPDGTLEYRPLNDANAALYPTPEAAEKFVGRVAYGKMSPEQRAQLRDVRPSDVRVLRVEDYFGPGTSAKAVELSKANLGLYKVLRAEAIKRGIIA